MKDELDPHPQTSNLGSIFAGIFGCLALVGLFAAAGMGMLAIQSNQEKAMLHAENAELRAMVEKLKVELIHARKREEEREQK